MTDEAVGPALEVRPARAREGSEGAAERASAQSIARPPATATRTPTTTRMGRADQCGPAIPAITMKAMSRCLTRDPCAIDVCSGQSALRGERECGPPGWRRYGRRRSRPRRPERLVASGRSPSSASIPSIALFSEAERNADDRQLGVGAAIPEARRPCRRHRISTFSPRRPRRDSTRPRRRENGAPERTSSSQGMLRAGELVQAGLHSLAVGLRADQHSHHGCSGTFASLSLGRRQRDIGAVAHPFPADLLASRVKRASRASADRRAERAHVEDSAVRSSGVSRAHRRAGLKDDRAGFLGRGYSGDRRALFGAGRVIAGGEHYRHAGLIRERRAQISSSPFAAEGERLEQIASIRGRIA